MKSLLWLPRFGWVVVVLVTWWGCGGVVDVAEWLSVCGVVGLKLVNHIRVLVVFLLWLLGFVGV